MYTLEDLKKNRPNLIFRTYYSIERLYDNIVDFVVGIYQKITRGFTDYEVWDLDRAIAEFTLPRLKHLRNIVHGHPVCCKDLAEWEAKLDSMILAFTYIIQCDILDRTDEMNQAVEEGLDLFRKHYFSLWD